MLLLCTVAFSETVTGGAVEGHKEVLVPARSHSCRVLNGGAYINNEFSDVYLVTVPEPWERSELTLQVGVDTLRYICPMPSI